MSRKNTNLKKRKTKKRKKVWLSLLLYLLFFTCIFSVAGFVSYSKFLADDSNENLEVLKEDISPEDAVEVIIPYNSTTNDIVEVLKAKGLVKYPFAFKFISKFDGYDYQYKSGKHIVSKEFTYEEIMKVLCDDPVTVTVTIPEGKNFTEIVSILDAKNVIVKDEFIKAANGETFNYEFLKDIPERENQLEGYLFPDTYFFDPASSPKEIIGKFLNNFDNKFKIEFYKRAEELGMSVDEIIILASIIEKETKFPGELSTVSSVFHNRLKTKDSSLKKLQSCATVQYILFNRDGKVKENLSDADTKIDHIYNTYLHDGLPPGPICNPGLDAIQAALYPDEESNYLYFVAKGDGSHYFSKTLQEHESAKKQYEANPETDTETETETQ